MVLEPNDAPTFLLDQCVNCLDTYVISWIPFCE